MNFENRKTNTISQYVPFLSKNDRHCSIKIIKKIIKTTIIYYQCMLSIVFEFEIKYFTP